MALQTQTVNVPGEGYVFCTISVTKNAGGKTMARALKDARRLDGKRLSEDGRKQAGRLANAFA